MRLQILKLVIYGCTCEFRYQGQRALGTSPRHDFSTTLAVVTSPADIEHFSHITVGGQNFT